LPLHVTLLTFATPFIPVQLMLPEFIGNKVADKSFIQNLYEGKVTRIVDEVFNKFKLRTFIIAGLVWFTNEPLPNVTEHKLNVPACKDIDVPPKGTAVSIPK
jgi:hypothetical protein